MKELLLRTQVAANGVRMLAAVKSAATRAIVVRYHAISPEQAPARALIPPGINHTPEQLRDHLRMLTRHFQIISPQELLSRLQERREMPPRAVVLTFDDGFADNFTQAAGVLDEFRVRAGFFLTTGLIGTPDVPWFCATLWAFAHAQVGEWTEPTFGRRWDLGTPLGRTAARHAANLAGAAAGAGERQHYLENLFRDLAAPPIPGDEPLMMDWPQARSLSSAGHFIDSHSVTHPNMALLSRADAYWEASESVRQLRERLGEGGRMFCYPNPFGKPIHDTMTAEILRAVGYSAALLTDAGAIHAGTAPYALPRLSSPPDPDRFRFSLERHFAGV